MPIPLLEILGLNSEFKELKRNQVNEKMRYLETALKNSKSDDNKEICWSYSFIFIVYWTRFVVLTVLIIMAFNKHKNMLKEFQML